MLLMFEKGNTGGICDSLLRCAKAKYMKNYNENEDSFFVMYLDNDNLYEYHVTCQWMGLNGIQYLNLPNS